MKRQPTTAAIGLLFALTSAAAHAEPAGPAFPGNEAVRIVNGKRAVEAPPLTAASQRYVKGGGQAAPAFCCGRGLHDRRPAGFDGVPRNLPV